MRARWWGLPEGLIAIGPQSVRGKHPYKRQVVSRKCDTGERKAPREAGLPSFGGDVRVRSRMTVGGEGPMPLERRLTRSRIIMLVMVVTLDPNQGGQV